MDLWGQFRPPCHARLPLGRAALAPGVLAIVVLISRWRGRSLATALTLRTLLVLAVGFAILAAVSTVAVVQTGLRELRQRHTSDLRALADGIGTTPLGLNGGDAQRRLASFRVKDPSVEFAAASIDGCQSTCVLSF